MMFLYIYHYLRLTRSIANFNVSLHFYMLTTLVSMYRQVGETCIQREDEKRTKEIKKTMGTGDKGENGNSNYR